MKSGWLLVGQKILGIIFIIIGIAGLFLPFIQGIALILLGSSLLGSTWLSAKIKKYRAWFSVNTKKP